MRFNTRLIFYTAIPALLFVLALATSLWGLVRTQNDFNHYIGKEQAIASGLHELLSQGLQGGQSLRNVVLNPSNKNAQKNLSASVEDYTTAYNTTMRDAQGTPFEAPLRALAEQRSKQIAVQNHIVELARTDTAAASQAINQQEIPIWRAMRATLTEQTSLARKTAEQAHIQTKASADRTLMIVLVLALLAVLVSVALVVMMSRTLQRELGCDPTEARQALRRMAEGDLSDNGLQQYGTPVGLMADLVRMRQHLRQLVAQVCQATQHINSAATDITQGNQDLSDCTHQQACAIEQTTTAMQELTTTMRQNADNAHQANSLAVNASAVAVQGGAVVAEVVRTMGQINQASHKIADIISVIDGIAFQTNILALNAAVEAARAGEQGRGFAVVASEVRNLAGRSTSAAKEIKDLVQTSVSRVAQGAQLVDQAGETMTDVVSAIQRVSAIVSQISVASNEQNSGVAQVGAAIVQIDHATQQNALRVQQNSVTAHSLQTQAGHLSEAVAAFDARR